MKPEDLANVAIVDKPGTSDTVVKGRKLHKPLTSSEPELNDKKCIPRPWKNDWQRHSTRSNA